MELWDIYNKQGEPTGKTVKRGHLRLRSGEYHMVVHIWIKGPDGRWIIQRRSEDKMPMAGEWAATGGSVISGETSVEAATRELFEELSIRRAPSELKNKCRIFRRHSILDIYVTEFDGDLSSLSLQPEEVAQVKWADEHDIRQMVEQGLFHNYGEKYFKNVFKNI